MTRSTILIIQMLIVCTLNSQNIHFQELSQTPPLIDARNGAVVSGDIDNDGDADLVISGRDLILNDVTNIYLNDGSGNFEIKTGTILQGVDFGYTGLADIDNDDDLDLLISGRNSSVTYANIYRNDGIGNFTLDLDNNIQPNSEGEFKFADIDNDNDMDLLVTGYDNLVNYDKIAKLYINNGTGLYTEKSGSPFIGVASSSVEFFDMDNDGDLDVIIAGSDIDDIPTTILYSNDGAGNFSLFDNSTFTHIYSGGIAVADTDNDGDQDILLVGFDINNIGASELYLNDGTGIFTIHPNTPFPKAFLATADFKDFNLDGKIDVLITGALGADVFTSSIYENNGDNNFGLSDTLIGVYLGNTAITDLDNDGDPDAIIVGISNETEPFVPRTYLNISQITETSYQFTDNEDVMVYPNPTSGRIYFNINNIEHYKITIYNSMGTKVYNNIPNEIPTYINQPSGIYTVKVENKTGIILQKIILK